MIRFYILPIDRQVINGQVYRGPMYFNWRWNETGINCRWSMKDYGSYDTCVLAADILQADHDALILHADVYDFPEMATLDDAMTQSDRGELLDFLELYDIPGDWIYAGITFREALRTITSMMLYMQRVAAIMGYPGDPFGTVTQNTQYQNVPNPLHDAMRQGALDLGYSWDVSNVDQLRKIFKQMGDQWGSKGIFFGFIVL